jgi:3-methylcrotonyl-CoA carboxylase alpha subunit
VFRKVLVANRGEIAARIMQTCAEMGVRTVAVYSDADARAMHVRRADESYRIGPAPATESYLDIERVVAAARQSGADAVHPGYGFLSENPLLAEACAAAGVAFVGPPPEAMRRLGSKQAAKRLAREAGVPVVPGYDGADQDAGTLTREAGRTGYPLLIKASAGGGGRGMRVVRALAALSEALESARREARASFGDDTVLLERLIERPRHVEVQVLADRHGNVVHLGERDCTVQRRHQKVIEESPSPTLSDEQRAAMGAAAVALARAAGYVNAGTVEFVVTPGGEFFFLEVNTRLQVEHPVTELVTGLDLVREQLRIAAGERLSVTQEDVRLRGHALECRLYAEDPSQGFRPSTGRLLLFQPPHGAGTRNDVGVETGDEVTPYYDPMLAKLVVAAPSRAACIERALGALRRYPVLGVTTNAPLLARILDSAAFREGAVWTTWLDEKLGELATGESSDQAPLAEAAVGAWRRHSAAATPRASRNPWLAAGSRGSVAGARANDAAAIGPHEVLIRDGSSCTSAWVADAPDATHVWVDGNGYRLPKRRGLTVDEVDAGGPTAGSASGRVEAPLTGTVAKVAVAAGDSVQKGQTVVVLEAMKMEIAVEAPRSGTVARVACTPGQLVQAGALLLDMEEH